MRSVPFRTFRTSETTGCEASIAPNSAVPAFLLDRRLPRLYPSLLREWRTEETAWSNDGSLSVGHRKDCVRHFRGNHLQLPIGIDRSAGSAPL